MTSKTVRLLSLIAAVGFWSAALAPAWAEADDPKALAAALKEATATLKGGLKASEPQGTPISAKFEIEDGKLQLSVQGREDRGCRGSQGLCIAESRDGKGEGFSAHRHRDRGQGQSRIPRGQRLSRAADSLHMR